MPKSIHKILLLIIFLLLLIASNRALALPDNVINYQGKLTDKTTDVAVADGNFSMIFSIYTAATGGTPVWTARGTVGAPTAKTVAVSKGIFSTVLGEAGDNTIGLDFNTQYYLGVTIIGDSEMDPRKLITASGFAINSSRLNGQLANYYLDTSVTTQTKSGALTVEGNMTVGNSSSDALIVYGGNSSGDIQTSSGAMNLTPYAGSNLNINLGTTGDFAVNADDLYVDTSSGNVGIGTTSPLAPLHISAGTGGTLLKIESTEATTLAYRLQTRGGSVQAFKIVDDTNSLDRLVFNGGAGTQNAYFTNVNLGIGTTSPGAKLEIGAVSTDNQKALILTANGPSGGGSAYSIYNNLNTTLNSEGQGVYGLYNNGIIAGSSSSYGIYNNFTGSGGVMAIATIYGTYNNLTMTNSKAVLYGNYSNLTTLTGSPSSYGNYFMTDAASTGGTQYAYYANMSSGTATKYGVYMTGETTDYFSGSVGIGDTSPDHKLDVAGNIGLDASSYINFGDTDGDSGYGFKDNSGTLQYKNSGGLWANLGGASGSQTPWTSNINADGYTLFGDDGSGGNLTLGSTSHATKGKILFGTSAYDEVNNWLGIGTVSPSSKIDITTTGLGTTQTDTSGLALVNTTASDGLSQISPALRWTGNGFIGMPMISAPVSFRSYVVPVGGAMNVTGYLTFESSVNGSTYGNSFNILTSGNVGIGTIAPSVKLHATTDNTATNTVTDILKINHSSSGTPAANFGTGLLFSGESTTTDARDMARIQSIWTTATDASRASALQFQTLTAAGALSTRMTIDGVGNVGIGTTTPGAKLDIGTISTTGIKGIQTTVNTPAYGTDYAMYNNLSTASSDSSTYVYGMYNMGTIGAAGFGYGVYNNLTTDSAPTITGTAYGIYNNLVTSGLRAENLYGAYTSLTTISSSVKTGYGNYFMTDTASTGGTQYAYYANMSSGTATKYGVYMSGETTNYFSGSVGIGDTSPDSPLEIVSTSQQLRLSYTDGSVDGLIYVDTNEYLTLQAGTASESKRVQIGAGGTGSTAPDFFGLDVKSDTGDPGAGGFEGAMYYNTADNKFRCYQNSGWTDCIGTGTGGGTLQNAYDYASGNTILTTTGRDITFTLGEVATPTSFTIENQDTAGANAQRIFNSITSGNTLTNGLLFEQTGTGTMTNAIQILETAGTITTGINIGNNVTTGISIGTGVTTGISIASGGITISGGALAINNATGITSNQATMIIDAGGTVDIRDIMNADSITTDTNGVTIASGATYSGAGAVTLASATGTNLTINSGTVGALAIGDDASAETINIATGAAAKALTIGSTNTTSSTKIQSGSGNINLEANNSSTGNVQVGDGGAASATPDQFVLDIGSAEPAGTAGAMYYSTALNKFRCYQNTAWTDCIGSGSGSPAGSNTEIQYNNSSSFGANAGLTFDSSTQTLGLNGTDAEILMNGITNKPSAPAAGTMLFYAKSIGGRMMPNFVGPSGVDTPIQPFFGGNKIGYWNPPGNATTVPGVFGFTAPTAQGTATARNVASTSMFTRMRRLAYVSVATAGGLSGHYNPAAGTQYTVGNGSGLGGFFYVVRFGVSDASVVTASRQFAGLSSATAAPTNVEPSTLTNSVGLCKNAADTNLKICYGGSAAQTPIDLGANFPVNTTNTDIYELILFAPTNANNTVYYRVTRLNTGNTSSGTLTAATPGTQLPNNTTFLGHRVWRTNNATAAAVGIDVVSVYIETDY